MENIKTKLKYLLLAIGLLVIYHYPIYVLFPPLDGLDYSIPFVTNFFESIFYWAYPLVELIGAILVVLIGVKLGFYKHAKTTFKISNLIFIIGAVIIAIVISFLIFHYFKWIFFSTDNGARDADIFTFTAPITQPLMISLLAPIYEETIFRGCLSQAFGNGKFGLLAVSVIFAFAHSGFTLEFWYYFPSSIILTFIYFRKKNLLDSMIAHATYNTFLNFGISLLSALFFKI